MAHMFKFLIAETQESLLLQGEVILSQKRKKSVNIIQTVIDLVTIRLYIMDVMMDYHKNMTQKCMKD